MKQEITPAQEALLRDIAGRRRYPVVRLELRSSREPALCSVALREVHMETGRETMEEVKARAALLAELAEKGLIRLRYGLFVTVAADYAVYPVSGIFAMLCELVEEGREQEGFLFDTAGITRGAAELTQAGRGILQQRGRDV